MRLKNSFGNCSKCGKQIMWIKTKAGKSMPCNPSFVYYKEKKGGKDRIVLTNGEVAVGTVQGLSRTCNRIWIYLTLCNM